MSQGGTDVSFPIMRLAMHLISALQKDSEPVQKITIVPRTMGALGYVMQTPAEEKFLNSKEEILRYGCHGARRTCRRGTCL